MDAAKEKAVLEWLASTGEDWRAVKRSRDPAALFYRSGGREIHRLAARGQALDDRELERISQDLYSEAATLERVAECALGYAVRARVELGYARYRYEPHLLLVLEPVRPDGGHPLATHDPGAPSPTVSTPSDAAAATVATSSAGLGADALSPRSPSTTITTTTTAAAAGGQGHYFQSIPAENLRNWADEGGSSEAGIRGDVAWAIGSVLRAQLGVVTGVRVALPVSSAWPTVQHPFDGYDRGDLYEEAYQGIADSDAGSGSAGSDEIGSDEVSSDEASDVDQDDVKEMDQDDGEVEEDMEEEEEEEEEDEHEVFGVMDAFSLPEGVTSVDDLIVGYYHK